MTDREFIAQIAPIIQKYARAYNYMVVSAVIAQACIESGFGRSTLASQYHNYFGLKCGSGWYGASVNMGTKEEYTPGTLTSIRDNFRVYLSMEDGVKGYYEFIQYPRYANLRSAKTAKQYLEYIKADGYATAYTYVTTCMRIVNTYDLTKYDTSEDIHELFPETFAGVVTAASGLRVRDGAGTQFNNVMVAGHEFILPKGICVAFEATMNGWGKLAGFDGWCSLSYIQR